MNFFPAYNLSALLSPRVLRLGFYGVGSADVFRTGSLDSKLCLQTPDRCEAGIVRQWE